MTAPGVGFGLLFAVYPRLLVPTLALVSALLVGALIIALFRRWQRADNLTPDSGEELARYRALYEQGTISEEEYRSLRNVLGGDLRRSMNLPPKPANEAEKPAEKSTDVQIAPGPSPGSEGPDRPTDGVMPAE